MISEGKKIARLRLIKRLGIIGLCVSCGIGLVFFILSLLPHGAAAFSMRIDNPTSTENSTFKIFANEDDAEAAKENGSSKGSVSYLTGDPLANAALIDAQSVENYLKTVTEFKGNNNFKTEDGKDLAMVFTIYLTNTTNEDIAIKYAVSLDGYKMSEGTSALIEYFRILVQLEEVGNANSLTNTYFGQKRSGAFDNTYVFDETTGRETITNPKTYFGEDGKTHIVADDTFVSPGNDGYCLNFNDYTLTKDIVNSEDSKVKVPVGKAIRFTFVAYFEGGDLDSYARAANDDYLLLSLHFGV